jgi:hypothetical protein
MQERRTDTRLLCAELVELIWRDEANREHRRMANLEDISLTGLCLCVEAAVREGTAVRVHYGDGELVGVIRYCILRDIGFILGMEFSDGCRWSTKHFRPQHMIDPRQLVYEAMERHDAPLETMSWL